MVDASQALEQQGKLNEVGVLVKSWIFDRLYEVHSILMIVIVIVISLNLLKFEVDHLEIAEFCWV